MNYSKHSIQFLNQLAQNNNRDWFNEHKQEYKSIQVNNKAFFNAIAEHLNHFDNIESIKQFRIYKDVRFSKDKTPYKTNFSAIFRREGEQRRGSYYLHLEPNQSYVAGGFYAPEKEDLYRIRKEFEYDAQPMRDIIASNQVQDLFGGVLQGDELKTAPRNFDKNDDNIDLIRKKNFYFKQEFTNKEIFQSDFTEKVIEAFQAMLPFFDYMSEVLTTNLNGESIL